MESGDHSEGNKTKPTNFERFDIKFEVNKHEVDISQGRYCLKLSKPDEPHAHCPNVSIKREEDSNVRAMKMMYTLNHKNILSMKAVGPKITDHEFLVFTEECIGSTDKWIWTMYYTSYGHIPSNTFQTVVREIIDGVEYLRRNGLYHGNLSWETTLYKHPNTVKLCNFKTNDLMTKEEAQWKDWISISDMLQVVSDNAVLSNQDPLRGTNFFCGEVDALIELIRDLDRNMLPVIKDTVLAEVFFWTKEKRSSFIMTTVSELILNEEFQEKINKSTICDLPWDSIHTNRLLMGDLCSAFVNILAHCNNYRQDFIPSKLALDPMRKADCIQLACLAYTLEDEIESVQGFVDLIFHIKYPKLFLELKRIVKVQMDEMKVESRIIKANFDG